MLSNSTRQESFEIMTPECWHQSNWRLRFSLSNQKQQCTWKVVAKILEQLAIDIVQQEVAKYFELCDKSFWEIFCLLLSNQLSRKFLIEFRSLSSNHNLQESKLISSIPTKICGLVNAKSWDPNLKIPNFSSTFVRVSLPFIFHKNLPPLCYVMLRSDITDHRQKRRLTEF